MTKASATPPFAIITPSYSADLERCKLLCESMDALAESRFRHYILVADHDVAAFKALEGPNRSVIPDAETLPQWMKAVRRPFSNDRYFWISTDLKRQIRPMSGWHVQQLRKLAAARIVDEDVLVMADSDSVFVRPFGIRQFVEDGRVRLYQKPRTITGLSPEPATHGEWTRIAARVLGLPEPAFPAADYINNLVSWRKDHARAVTARIEEVGTAPAPLVLGRVSTLSEYQIYGAFAAGLAGMEGHFANSEALSHTYWTGQALTPAGLNSFMAALRPEQIALCVQSFTETPLELLRDLFRASARAASHT